MHHSHHHSLCIVHYALCIAVAAFSAATAYEARTVSIADTHYAEGLASSFDLVFGAGNVTNALYVAYGTFDGGADPKAWQNLVKITDIAPETSAYTVSAPAGWGTSVNALRFFMADIEQGPYDYSVEYIASTGADQGIDTGRHLFYGETFTLVWRQYALTGLTAEDKGWGAGTSGDKNITGGGRRNNNRLRTYIRRGHRDFSPVFPTSDLTTNVIYRDVCAVTDPISYTMTALDGENAGSVWTLADTLTPYSGTSYDSAANIYLFRDYQNPYWGKKAIYRATLLDVNGDLAFDFIPVSLNGKLCFYDKVSGAYKYNLGATSFESGPQVGAKRGEIGASSATAPVFSTVLPVLALIPEITARADGTATIPFILSSAGAGAAAADVIYRVGYAPDALGAETVAVASASPGPGSFTLSGLAPGRVCYVSAYASSSAGDSAVQGPVAFMTPESGATGRTFAMTATNRVSGAIVSVDITYSASAEPARLFMAYGATDGGDDPYDWDGLKYVCDVAPYAFSQTVAVPAGWGDDVQAMRLFLTGMPAGYDRELEYIASTGAQGIDTGRHLLFGDIFTLDWRQYDLTGLNSEDKGWGTGTANANYIAGGGRRSFSNVKTYICNNNNDFSPVFKTSDLSTEVRYRDVCAVTNPITYTMTALDGAAAGTVWTAPTVAKTSYDSSVNIFLFRGAGTSTPYPGKKAIYRATLIDANGEKAFDLIPVVKNGTPCMFDIVSGAIRYNVGNEDFIAGPYAADPVVMPADFTANAPTLSIAGLPVVVAGEVVPQGDYKSVAVGYDVRETGAAATVAVSLFYGPSSDALTSSNLLAAAAGPGTGTGILTGLVAGRTYYARLVANANGVTSEPSPLFSFTCSMPATSAGGGSRPFTGVSAAHGTATASFAPYIVATPLYVAYGTNYGGDTTNGWEHVVKVTDAAPSATSATFPLPEGWGREIRFLRFFFIVDGADVGVEFLDRVVANGAEYIDTGLYPNTGLVVRADFQTTDTSHDKMVFGERVTSGPGFNFILWLGKGAGTGLAPVICGTALNGRSSGAAQGDRIDVAMGVSTGIVANGNAVFSPHDLAQFAGTDTAPVTLKLMGLQSDNDIDPRKYYGSLYAFEAWQDGQIVQSLMPCRTTDGTDEVALFDAVTGVLFHNAGGGAFGAGETISRELVARSELVVAPDASLPSLGEVAATGEWRGDRVTVSGTLESAGAGDCVITVETSRLGDFTDAVVWTADGTYASQDSFTVELFCADTASPSYIVPGATFWYRVKATDRAGALDASVPAAVTTPGAMSVGVPAITSAAGAFTVTVPVTAVGANTNWAWVVYSTANAALGSATEKVAIPHDYAEATFTVDGISAAVAPATLTWALVVSNDCSTATWVSSTEAASRQLVNNIRYTWRKGVRDGIWEDAANWDAPEGRYDYPTAVSDAYFLNGTTARVAIATSAVTVRQLYVYERNVDLVFHGGSGGTNHALTVSENLFADATGGTICISNLSFEVTRGGVVINENRLLKFCGGARVGFYNNGILRAGGGPGRHIEISDGTYLEGSGQVCVGGAGSTVVFDDCHVRMYVQYQGFFLSSGADGGEFIIRGRNPRLESVTYFRSSMDRRAGGTITFVIPEGGYAQTPIMHTPRIDNNQYDDSRPFAGDVSASQGRVQPMTIRIDPDSPGLQSGRTLRQPLVSWKGGLSLEKMALEPVAVRPRINRFAYAAEFDDSDGPYGWETTWTDGEAPLTLGFIHEQAATVIMVR